MTRKRTSAIDAMTDEAVKRSGAATRDEYLNDVRPTRATRDSGQGKGDKYRPCYISRAELARRQWALWVVCPKCEKQQMRKEKCLQCGAKLPQAKLLHGEK